MRSPLRDFRGVGERACAKQGDTIRGDAEEHRDSAQAIGLCH
jgi:hypothetical protein